MIPRWLVVVALCGCTQTIDYSLRVLDSEPATRPPRAELVSTFIDGIETDTFEATFDGTPINRTFRIELRSGALVVASIEHTVADLRCDGEVGDAVVSDRICGFASGDLRSAGRRVTSDSETCIADGFCLPACSPFSPEATCGEGGKCSVLEVSASPVFSHVGCAPSGPRQLGDACTYIDGPDGAYDDCASGLLCVDGTCRTWCSESSCEHCEYVPGFPPEMRVCNDPI